MTTELKKYFPMLREREEILAEIGKRENLRTEFESWEPEQYYHMFEQKSDTGLKLELLQKYVFIPLDIFRENQQNKNIKKKLDAWLTLLSYEEPEKIIELIKKYPEFRKIYEEGSEICRNTERVMEMFSKELYELDKNTVQYMIDEMQDTIDAQKEEIGKQQTEMNAQKKELEKQQDVIDRMEQEKEDIQKENEKIQKKQVEMQMERENAIIGTINLLRTMNVSEEEIIRQVCGLYQIDELQAEKYFDGGDLVSGG